MKKNLFLLLLLLVVVACRPAADTAVQSEYDAKMEWWRQARFGMFIHWGPYALWGGEYHGHRQARGGAEWIMNRCKIPVEEYRAMAATFNPTKYDADKWVLTAKEAGMKYIVFTTKHHDGFAMFDSEASDFNIVDYTPYKRDILDELATACRSHGMKLGFYYSQAQDWNNPGGATARRLSAEGWPNPDSARVDAYTAANRGSWDPHQTSRPMEEYIEKVSLPQVRELLTRYGDVAVIWWDTPTNMTKEFAERFAAELASYPQVIQNDRLKRPDFPGDYKTPEGLIPKSEDVEGLDWETCMNIGSSWGWKSWENAWKSDTVLIRNLVTIASRGGNYLLNVGPTPEGEFPPEALERLAAMGRWMKTNGEAIYETQRSLLYPEWGQVTRKDSPRRTSLYLCVFDWPADGRLTLDASYGVKGARLLATGQKLKAVQDGGRITIEVPDRAPDGIASVIRLELTDKLPPVILISNSQKAFEIVDEK